MTDLQFDAPVILVGAGPATQSDFDAARVHTPHIVAVDGGADHLAAWGVAPDVVLGDMDSIRAPVPEGVPVHAIEEQDSTDLEKALRIVTAPILIGIGFIDGRLDHTLAAMHALVAAEASRVVLLGSEDAVFAAPHEWRVELAPETRISFYPVRRVPAIGSKGLRWPIDGLLMEGGMQIGVSNETTSTNVAAWFAERGVVTVLPREWLGAVIESLT